MILNFNYSSTTLHNILFISIGVDAPTNDARPSLGDSGHGDGHKGDGGLDRGDGVSDNDNGGNHLFAFNLVL